MNDSFLHPPWLHRLLTVGINDYFMVEEQLSRTLFCFGILFQVRAAPCIQPLLLLRARIVCFKA